MHEYFSIFMQSSQSWIETIRRVVQPIFADIFKSKNVFNGSLTHKQQDEYISPFLLSLISMLIDGEINTEETCMSLGL